MREIIAQELIAKASQAILEAHRLRRQRRLLRLEASVRASEFGETMLGGSRIDQVERGKNVTPRGITAGLVPASGFGSGLSDHGPLQ